MDPSLDGLFYFIIMAPQSLFLFSCRQPVPGRYTGCSFSSLGIGCFQKFPCQCADQLLLVMKAETGDAEWVIVVFVVFRNRDCCEVEEIAVIRIEAHLAVRFDGIFPHLVSRKRTTSGREYEDGVFKLLLCLLAVDAQLMEVLEQSCGGQLFAPAALEDLLRDGEDVIFASCDEFAKVGPAFCDIGTIVNKTWGFREEAGIDLFDLASRLREKMKCMHPLPLVVLRPRSVECRRILREQDFFR